MAGGSTTLFDFGFALRILPALLSALWTTVLAVAVGMAVALVLGLVWAILRRAAPRPIAAATHTFVELIRSTPLLIQLYFLYFVLPESGVTLPALLTGVLGLGLHYSTYTAEVYRAGIEAVPRGQWEAATALGFSSRDTWRRIVIPQAIPRVLPALGNYLVAIFKDTPLLSAIAVPELLKTAKIIGAERFRYLEPLTLVGVLFLVLSLIAASGIRQLERRHVVRHS